MPVLTKRRPGVFSVSFKMSCSPINTIGIKLFRDSNFSKIKGIYKLINNRPSKYFETSLSYFTLDYFALKIYLLALQNIF